MTQASLLRTPSFMTGNIPLCPNILSKGPDTDSTFKKKNDDIFSVGLPSTFTGGVTSFEHVEQKEDQEAEEKEEEEFTGGLVLDPNDRYTELVLRDGPSRNVLMFIPWYELSIFFKNTHPEIKGSISKDAMVDQLLQDKISWNDIDVNVLRVLCKQFVVSDTGIKRKLIKRLKTTLMMPL